MTTVLRTQNLGEIRGKDNGVVSQFLGIKYASLKDRLSDAVLVEQRSGDILDATKDGPMAVSLPDACQIELAHVQHSLPQKELVQSDIDCLNLNIAMPSTATSTSNLPVLFFIHGGGLFIGANSWPQYDLERMTELSIEKGFPTVIVAINYRLGAPGFLTSKELRNAGYKANNGLRDQRVALKWVQRHIHQFGGDPKNITACGMSAGGASVTYHLHSEEPLFKRAISMSGTSLLSNALSYEKHEENYQNAVIALGLAGKSPAERINAILKMPPSELVGKLPPSILTAPAIDSDIVIPGVTYSGVADLVSNVLPGQTWCTDLLIGDAEVDASIFLFLKPQMKENCAKKFTAAVNKVLGTNSDTTRHILENYKISEETPDGQAISSIIGFLSDIVFHAPVLAFASGWRGNVYVYHFNEGNPWDGQWKGRANHILDIAYIFQNFREYLGPDENGVSVAFAEDFFRFCHGVVEWPAVTPGEISAGFSARVYGPSHEGAIVGITNVTFGQDSRRRGVLFDSALDVSLDQVADVFSAFQSG